MLRNVVAALLLCWAFVMPAQAGTPAGNISGQWMVHSPAPTGRWITASHDAVIQIAPCGADICGWIAGIVLAPTDPIPKDWEGAPQCGLTIIRATPSVDGAGQTTYNGSIVDPRDGSAYHAQINLDASGDLHLRGYIGLPMFGRTQVWAPYTGKMNANCRL